MITPEEIENRSEIKTPGKQARAAHPASRGSRIVMTRFWSRGPGAKCTAELPEPKTVDRTKGMVRMPSRFVLTVSNKASAAFPPAAYQLQL